MEIHIGDWVRVRYRSDKYDRIGIVKRVDEKAIQMISGRYLKLAYILEIRPPKETA